MNELHLFAGAGGGVLAGHLLGHRCVCAVEREPYAQAVLVARQNDGSLPPFPIWDDVQTFDGKPWRGVVDIVAGGFPCQDISSAGNREGIEGARSSLWREMARIVGEVRPRYVLVENSADITSRGLGVVLGDLAALGYDCRWDCLPAAFFGAPHFRNRAWIVADAHGFPGQEQDEWTERSGQLPPQRDNAAGLALAQHRASQAEAVFRGMDDVLAHRMVRNRALGNGQVSGVAAGAFRVLTEPRMTPVDPIQSGDYEERKCAITASGKK